MPYQFGQDIRTMAILGIWGALENSLIFQFLLGYTHTHVGRGPGGFVSSGASDAGIHGLLLGLLRASYGGRNIPYPKSAVDQSFGS